MRKPRRIWVTRNGKGYDDPGGNVWDHMPYVESTPRGTHYYANRIINGKATSESGPIAWFHNNDQDDPLIKPSQCIEFVEVVKPAKRKGKGSK